MRETISLILNPLILLNLITPGLSLATAQVAPIPAVPVITAPSGFDEGTETRLSPSQIEDILPWATNSQMQLKDLLEMVKPLQPQEAKVSLIQGIQSIVSASAPKRTETLMRYVLNRALKINEELEREMPSNESAAINVELRVLKLSAQLAVKYYESDIEYLKRSQAQETQVGPQPVSSSQASSTSPGEVTLPLAKFGQEYAAFLMNIDRSILDASAQYNVAMMALGLLQWDLYRDGKERTRCAPAIAKINNFLRVMPEKAADGDANAVMKLRQIRQVYQKVEAILGEAMGAVSSFTSPVYSGGSSAALQNASFVRIKAGTFMMGSPSSENSRDSDETQHSVTLTKDFEIQTTDVTQIQWIKVMGSNPSKFQTKDNCPDNHTTANGVSMCPNHPVEQVSWNDVQEFIGKLNAESRDGYWYRLPTEAEWEYAARAGTQTVYSSGNDTNRLGDFAWFDGNSQNQTHDVARLKPNGFGLYDMHGNVWQWVQDWYGAYPSTSVTDPVGLPAGSYRVIRGGGWSCSARSARSASRDYGEPGGRASDLGFRLARVRGQ